MLQTMTKNTMTNRLNRMSMEWVEGSTPNESSEGKVEAEGTTLPSCYTSAVFLPGGASQDASTNGTQHCDIDQFHDIEGLKNSGLFQGRYIAVEVSPDRAVGVFLGL